MSFIELPGASRYLLHRACIPSTLLSTDASPASTKACTSTRELVEVDLEICDGRIAAIRTCSTQPDDNTLPVIALNRKQVWPCYIDAHTHLDKSHTADRTFSADRSLIGAIEADALDQQRHWSVQDLVARMDFALRCAYAHGTCAMRTHLISNIQMRERTWKAYQKVKTNWAGRIELQAVSLVLLEELMGHQGETLADFTQTQGGILGCAIINKPGPEIVTQLDHIFQLAKSRQLDLDFHADENLDPASSSLREIAKAKIRHNFDGNVVVGHCCSLSVQKESDVQQTLDLVKESGVAIISLPATNLYLQERNPGRTPRHRGISQVHEIVNNGINLAFASDNCCDLFNMYGDYDLHQIYTQGSLAAHLDLDMHQWPALVTKAAAEITGFSEMGRVKQGAAANLILFNARSFQELLARPQSDRVVIRNGEPISTQPPSFELLNPNR